MTESPQQFGPDAALVGVLTQPGASATAPKLAFLLFNAGVIPRIGPHRTNVKLARALAAQGQPVLRFDLAGRGDSRNATTGGDFIEQGTLDIQAAMDHLESTLGIRHFALIGVCSGAVNAYWASLADDRVSAVMMLDGYWYRTRWTAWVRDWKVLRAASPRAAWAAVLRRSGRWASNKVAADVSDQGLFSADTNPPDEDFSRGMAQLVERCVEVFIVYSGSVIDYYSYQAQLRHRFAGAPWLPKVRCELHPEFDHNFIALSAQQHMLALVLDWLPDVLKARALQK